MDSVLVPPGYEANLLSSPRKRSRLEAEIENEFCGDDIENPPYALFLQEFHDPNFPNFVNFDAAHPQKRRRYDYPIISTTMDFLFPYRTPLQLDDQQDTSDAEPPARWQGFGCLSMCNTQNSDHGQYQQLPMSNAVVTAPYVIGPSMATSIDTQMLNYSDANLSSIAQCEPVPPISDGPPELITDIGDFYGPIPKTGQVSPLIPTTWQPAQMPTLFPTIDRPENLLPLTDCGIDQGSVFLSQNSGILQVPNTVIRWQESLPHPVQSQQIVTACVPYRRPSIDSGSSVTTQGSPVYSSPISPEFDVLDGYFKQISHPQPEKAPKQAKRTAFKSPEDRKITAKTREMNSCIRCRAQKIRCLLDESGAGCCQTCKKAQPNTRLWRIPCLRYKLSECELFKPCEGVDGLKWTSRWSSGIEDIDTWASNEVRTIILSDGYTNRGVIVTVRQFVPMMGDKLQRTWVTNGVKRSVDIPAWAICDIANAEKQYRKHLFDGFSDCIYAVLINRHPMLYETYLMALYLVRDDSQSMANRDLLMKTMQLWMAIRLTTKSTSIVGDETLGMPSDIIDDEAAPMYGKIPVPPVLGAQVDMLLIQNVQMKLREEILKQLNDMVIKNNKHSWLVLYLVSFILLHNIAMITAHDASYATKHGLGRRYARVHKVKEYHQAAKIILGHFHYCCRGQAPFDAKSKISNLKAVANLSDSQFFFLQETRDYVSKNVATWEAMRERGEYENDFFFVSQMYIGRWSPIDTEV